MPENYIEEDEIDLRELFNTILKNKKLIFLVTSIITILAIIYAYAKTPIYEVKSNIQVGFIDINKGQKKELVNNPSSIVHLLKVIFHVDEKIKQAKFVSEVSNINVDKKVKNFLQITTSAISNKEAINKNKEVVSYLQARYEPKIEQYLTNQKNKIENIKIKLKKIDENTIPSINKQIDKLKNQDIVKIQNKIKFYRTVVIPSLKEKILQQQTKLNEYNKAIKKLYQNMQKSEDTSITTIVSIQMINYQNQILNSQNKIEDYKVQIDKIKTEYIQDLENKKQNIINDNIWKLEQQLTLDIPNQKLQLNQQIKALEYSLSNANVQNSHIVGDMIVKDYPTKPKKKLIVIVAFVTGLILSIFLVFFLEFLKGFKEEETKNK